MLFIRFDHRFERLADALLDSLDAAATGPFAERVVIVPSAGVGRWLQRRDARRHGISARLRPEFAGRWLWQTMRALLEDLPVHSPFEPERARWALMSLFDELPEDSALALLRARLREPGSRARIALADSVARLFERYLAYRRDWLARWQQGLWAGGPHPLDEHEPWQRWIWQRLLERLPEVRDEHPYDQFVRCLSQNGPARVREALAGRRVALFGRVGLAPEQFALLGQLSASIDVSVFAPDPCRELWTDMLDTAELARIRESRPDVAWMYEGEPSLLGNWGRVHRDFVAQVLALEESFGVQAEAPGRDEPLPFADPPRTALQALQAAIFLRSDEPWRNVAGCDASITVHGAHGTVREAEILHETLLECFESLPGLSPADVVVHCVDVDAAARAIEGVFASAPDARRIPIAVSGRPARSDPLVGAVQALLAMTVAGVDAAALDEWLRNAAVMEALDLDEGEVARLLVWFERAGGRRGLDAADGSPKHSMQAAAERLLLGAAIGSGAPFGGLLAVPGAHGDRALLEAWLSAADALARLRTLAGRARGVHDWCQALAEIVDSLFGRVRRHAGGLHLVRDAIGELARSASDAAVHARAPQASGACLDASAFAFALGEALEEGAAAAMPTGAVTVCPIGSLLGVPFRVVCLFGLDEGAFPRRGAADEIDLMRRAPRFGDRLVRNDDRGVFLDAVLAARERLVILCQGRDPRDDAPRNPSALVVELLAYLSARLAPDSPQAALALARVRSDTVADTVAGGDAVPGVPALIEHPLHAFSLRNFTGASRRYADEWLPAARALAEPLATRPARMGPLFEIAGDADAPATSAQDDEPSRIPLLRAREGAGTSIETVRAALADPAATWLRRRLALTLPEEVAAPPDTEPLWPEARADLGIVQSCVDRLLAGEADAALVAELALAPRTAAGAAGVRHAGSIVASARALVERALGASGGASGGASARASAAPVEIVVARVDDVRLHMRRPVLDAMGQPLFVSAFPLVPRALIDAWLRTALWRFAVDSSARGRLVCADESLEFVCPDPLRSLRHALDWSERIAREPLALFPRSWLRYAIALERPPRRGDTGAGRVRAALARAQEALCGGHFGAVTAELDRPHARALYRDAEIDFESVLPLCERVYRVVLDDAVRTREPSSRRKR